MSTVSYPLATLAVTVGPAGPSAPAFQDVLGSLGASLESIYGDDIVLLPATQDGQLVGLVADAINDSNQATIAGINNFNPAYSQGSGQDTTYLLNGIQRQVSSNSTMPVQLVGVAGTPISAGGTISIVQDQNGNLWDLPSCTIPAGGETTVTAVAEVQGALACPAQALIIYARQSAGWQSAASTAAATPGAPVEADGAFRQRQAISTAITGITPLQAIAAGVAAVAGVTRSVVYENNTNNPGTGTETPPLVVGQPAHSICAVVEGGTLSGVAQAIEQVKAPGTGTSESMAGITTVLVEDPSGVPVNISFFVLSEVNCYVDVKISALTGYVASTGTAVIAAIVAFINNLGIGNTVRYNWLFGPASLYGSGLEFTFKIDSIAIGLAAAPTGTADIPVVFNQAAATDAANVTVEVI